MFIQVLVPTLKRECGGCHFPGGNFYGSFPFDESRIVLDRLDEILIRMEDDAVEPFEYWRSISKP